MYKHCLLLHKVFNDKIPRKEWINLNFQIINTRRQKFFEVQNSSVYKVGNNILINRLSCLNKKIELDMLNQPLKSFKIVCKRMFLLWFIPLKNSAILLHMLLICPVLYVFSIIMSLMHWRRNNKIFKKSKSKKSNNSFNIFSFSSTILILKKHNWSRYFVNEIMDKF